MHHQSPLITFRRPSLERVREFVADQESCELTYEAVGATATTPPAGFDVDRTRITLGRGERVFREAAAALRQWRQFQLGWVEPGVSDTPLEVGRMATVLGRAMGLWWLNACRIVYVVDESGDAAARFGFAYGTLPGHVECGEERFLLEWDRASDRVDYEILAFSRPLHLLARIGYPVVRRQQKRFGRDSAAAMFRIVDGASPVPEIDQSSRRPAG